MLRADQNLDKEKEVLIPPFSSIRAQYKNPEKLRPLMYQSLTGMILRQKRLVKNIPDIVLDLSHPSETTGEFYRKYFETFGQDEQSQTIDRQQLFQRIIHHPSFENILNRNGSLRLMFAGCSSGINNIEADVIRHTVRNRPRLSTTFVGLDPYPPTKHNSLLDPYYSQNLSDMANNKTEFEKSDGLFFLGSGRMDINLIIERLKTNLGIYRILKPGGFVAIEEAVPPSALPESGNLSEKNYVSYAREAWLDQVTGAPDLDSPGFFRRTWLDNNGQEFGKMFYAEPLEIYYFLMQEFGFKPTLSSYRHSLDLLQNPNLTSPWSRVRIAKSQHFQPDPKDAADQMFFQSIEGKWRRHLRYIMFWEKIGEPNPSILQLMEELDQN